MFITLTGLDAMRVAVDANLAPEVLLGVQWTPARSLAQARAMAGDDPNTVRLRGDPRILLENILRQPILPGADLMAVVQAALAVNPPPSLSLIQAQLP
jgi:hypothetical protein